MTLGLLDLPSPLFGLLDAAMGFLPALLRIAAWALLSAVATMWLYKRFSKQDELAELKPRIKSVQQRMAKYDGPMAGLWPLIGESMRLSGRQMGMTLWPALVASLPVLFVLAFLSNEYGHRMPAADEPVAVVPVQADSAPAQWRWTGDTEAAWSPEEKNWEVTWPASAAVLEAPDYGAVLTLPPEAPASVIHKRQWWNWLIGNPAGYLADDAPLEAVEMGLPRQRFLGFGPGWLGYWEIPYLVLLVVFSLAIKIRFRIH